MKKITVLIADDHAIVREGLRLILETFEDIAVVGEAADGQQALREAQRVGPDVVLMDLSMPLLNGAEATRQITRERPGTKVIVLSTYSDDAHVQRALEAGAAGYLMKETASKDLLRAIQEARKGNAFFSPAIAMRLLKECRNRHSESKTASARELSSRQKEVVQLIAEGYSSSAIAGLLSVTTKKLDIHNIAALTRYAVSSGIVDSNYVPIARSQHARSSRFDGQQKPALSPTKLAA
jgi:DNA-binding NarL/FixJ family response regulator